MTLRRALLAVLALQVGGYVGGYIYGFVKARWDSLPAEELVPDFTFSVNPNIPWLNGEDADEDAEALIALRAAFVDHPDWVNHG